MKIKTLFSTSILLTIIALIGCAGKKTDSTQIRKTMKNTQTSSTQENVSGSPQIVYLGAGCFWCIEAQFDLLEGVTDVVSGYMGGDVDHPTYKQVCTGRTGHAEVIQVTYDPAVISFPQILEAFFVSHDPTTLNRQGNDVGTQYRSAIFYTTEDQKENSEQIIRQLDEAKAYPDPIVTEVTEASNFYPAEDYHQQYYELNGEQPYCRMVIQPKQEKFKKVFADKLKK